MDKFQELKSSYDKVINTVCQYNPNANKVMIQKYLLSISFRMWASNSLYAKEYDDAIAQYDLPQPHHSQK